MSGRCFYKRSRKWETNLT